MPLPFLTADRAFDTSATTSRCRSTTTISGGVPTGRGPGGSARRRSLLLLASFVLLAAMIIAAAGALSAARASRLGTGRARHPGRPAAAARGRLGEPARAAPRGLLLDHTVPWDDGDVAVRTVQQPVRWLGLPRTVQGQALVLVTAGW